MIPIVKGWSTEVAQEVTSLGVQVHGGMGFIEETGAAQHYRDARIITIYEGTTGIQANDLIGRKTARDGGAVAAIGCCGNRQGRGAARVARRHVAAARSDLRLAAATVGASKRDRLDGARVRQQRARRARGGGAVPEAVGIGGRRLADGSRGAGCGASSSRRATATPNSCAPRSPRRASTPRTFCRRPMRLPKPLRKGAMPCWHWTLRISEVVPRRGFRRR